MSLVGQLRTIPDPLEFVCYWVLSGRNEHRSGRFGHRFGSLWNRDTAMPRAPLALPDTPNNMAAGRNVRPVEGAEQESRQMTDQTATRTESDAMGDIEGPADR